jgi:adenylate cyclase
MNSLVNDLREFLSGGHAVMRDAELPERVRRALVIEQDRAERVIGWFQLGIVIFFAAFYGLAPRPADRPMGWEPVPIALGLYLGATLIRLVWARRMRLPGWSLAGSIMIDMTLLFGLIWSFHLQYGQPPSFYLKAPTVLYVFVFIALRTLRFESIYVLLAGGVAALWWLALVIYAVIFDPQGEPITRDYVRYLSSNAILIGAEIDKIVTILVVSALLAWSLRRARRTLVRAVSEGAAASELKRFFDADVAKTITSADESVRPGQGVRRDAAAMFVDLRGFTTIGKDLSADELVQLLAEYQSRLVPVIQRNGGSIDKFLGDGILASFGAARASNTYAADAFRAADALLAEAELWRREREAAGKPAPRVGCAIATGPILFGAVGDETRLEYTVIGESVNLAAKLEKHTKVERVAALATREAHDVACHQGYAPSPSKEIRSTRTVAGVSDPIDLAVIAVA